MNAFTLPAVDGYPLAAYRFESVRDNAPPKAIIVIAPAMATPQSFYAHFARHLAEQGIVAITFDYRGTGESIQVSMRQTVTDLTTWIEKDCDAVIQFAQATWPTVPLIVVGHSVGGQTAPLLPSRDRVNGLVNIAVGSGARRHNVPSLARKAPLLWHVVVPVLCAVFGYFPGGKIGVVGDLPRGAILQWRRWCLSPDYLLGAEPRAREAYRTATFPVLALTFADDELLLEAGSRMLHAAYPATQVDYRLIAPAAHGVKRIGHFGFFKPASEATLWPMVTQWIHAVSHRAQDR